MHCASRLRASLPTSQAWVGTARRAGDARGGECVAGVTQVRDGGEGEGMRCGRPHYVFNRVV
jgi:hypothetical protein